MSKRIFLTCVTFLLVWFCVALPLSVTAQQGGRTTYVYDDNGRLTAVVLPTGEAAIYQYDAAGNIVSIARQIYTIVSIIEFTPGSGDVGTQVTIYGTGFSLNPGQNTVAFNGATAQIISNDATQIVTSVPPGATTGPITITTPTGSAVSRTPFIISPPPTITDITPNIGVAGDSVTITGTDFATVASDNVVKFVNTVSEVTSAISTTLQTSVPVGATSGHVSVTTTSGSATSDGDFFVPPSPYVTSDVDTAVRMTLGESKVLSINQCGHIGMAILAHQRCRVCTGSHRCPRPTICNHPRPGYQPASFNNWSLGLSGKHPAI